MNLKRKHRLYYIAILVAGIGIATALISYALSENIDLFYSPSQVVAGEAPTSHSFRVGGLVVKNSVIHSDKKLSVQFRVTDNIDSITIFYDGILPDLFREGQGIVAQGKFNDKGQFIASQVLAKHDEKYMPPQVKAMLEKQT